MHTRPILGFVGSSGSGKTTLLESIVSLLSDKGVRLAVVKHAKAGFDLDQNPRKDSHRLRAAGAGQVLVASRDRWALMGEQPDPLEEPSLFDMVRHLEHSTLDAVLVEGFRHEHFPKIEVYRLSQGQPPQCWIDDPDVIAVASDGDLSTGGVPLLDLNDHLSIACFAARHLGLQEPDSEYIVDRSAAGQQP
jgi:molybdopterin-guanine dinucleotide biosynthesis protein MobB